MSIPGVLAILSVAGTFAALGALSAVVAAHFRWRWLIPPIIVGPPLLVLLVGTVGVGVITQRFHLDGAPFIGMAISFLLGVVLALMLVVIGSAGASDPRAQRWRPGVVLAMLMTFLVVTVASLLWIDRQRLDRIEVFRARSTALKESLSFPVDPVDDAGPVYMAAIEFFDTADGKTALERVHDLLSDSPVDAEGAREAIKPFRSHIDRVLEATSRTRCSFGHDPRTFGLETVMPMPEWSGSRNIARLLALEAHLAAVDRDARRAEQSINGMVRLANHVGQTPTLTWALVADAIRALARTTYLEAGATIDLDPGCLQDHEGTSRRTEMKNALVMERAVMTDAVCRVAIGNDTSNLEEVNELFPMLPAPPARWAYRSLVLPTELEELDGYFDLFDAALNRPGADLPALPPHPRGILTYVLLPALDMAVVSVGYAEQLDRIPPIAAAARRFERDHGRWPTALDELVPRYLDVIPDDLLAPVRAPMRMAIVDGNLVIYSVGPNGTDEGGSVDFGSRADLGYILRPATPRGQ